MTIDPFFSHFEDVDLQSLSDEAHSLFRHTRRPQWGFAIVVWERGDKRAYQFQDGELRVFKQDFYGLLEEVEPEDDEASDLVEELHRRLNRSLNHRQARASSRPLQAVWPFETQLEILRVLHPDGFRGEGWLNDIRGTDAARRLKRHRDIVLAEASAVLGEQALGSAIAEGAHERSWAGVVELLGRTNLLTSAQLAPLSGLAHHRHPTFVEALHAVLWGSGDFDTRFEALMASLDSDTHHASWPLLTALLALGDPARHVCVHPTTFRRQAGSVAPTLLYPASPSALGYRNYRRMAKATRHRLEKAGLHPADMMDVHDFMALTLKPSARNVLKH